MPRKYLPLFVILGICLLSGCATNSDLRLMRATMDSNVASVEEKASDLQKETAALRREIEKTNESIISLRKAEADVRADMTEIRDQVRQLKGQAEILQKDQTSLQARGAEARDFKERLDQVSFKINYIENFLGISKKDGQADNGSRNGGGKGKGDREAHYAAAYESFKDGKYEKARLEFLNFLKAYPDSEYSSNAQFWIGECYYFEKKYEKAILEYEKVIKHYPEGNKVPYALLKQGLSFLNLGDKASAKAILQSIIKDYPNTNQARIARSKLLEIK